MYEKIRDKLIALSKNYNIELSEEDMLIMINNILDDSVMEDILDILCENEIERITREIYNEDNEKGKEG